MLTGGRVTLILERWERAGPTQALALVFLVVVIALTTVRAAIIAWSAYRAAPAEQLSARTMRLARSTYGLALAGVWFTCAAGAVGCHSAMIQIGNSSEPIRSAELKDYLQALETSGIGFGLASLLIIASLIGDLIATRLAPIAPAPVAPPALVRWTRVAPGLFAIVTITWLLVALRSTAVAAAENTYFLFDSFYQVHQQLWTGLAIICASAGVMSWLGALIESAILRRQPT
jgi:hypothetical protein